MTRVLAIDPGNIQSAYVVTDHDRRPLWFGKVDNDELRRMLYHPHIRAEWDYDLAAVEMIASYGMPVGAEVFDTCVWLGRFAEIIARYACEPLLVYRKQIKVHHCGTTQAKDSNIRQALVDRFAKGQPNHGKGTRADPGWFHGFRADIWQAYAVAVYVTDTEQGGIW